MKKQIAISLILSSIVLIGCGGGGGDTEEPKTVSDVLKLGDAVVSAPQNIDFQNKTRMQLKVQKEMYKKFFKLSPNAQKETYSCSQSGTMSAEENATAYILSFDECINYNDVTGLNEYMDGGLEMSQSNEKTRFNEYYFVPDINYYTGSYMNIYISMKEEGNLNESFMDGTMEEYVNDYLVEAIGFSKFSMKNDTSRKAWFMEGQYSYESGCFSESHMFKTEDWLIESSSNADEWSAGTINVDGARYTYQGSDVSVEKDGKTGTFTQQALAEEMENQANLSDSTCRTKETRPY